MDGALAFFVWSLNYEGNNNDVENELKDELTTNEAVSENEIDTNTETINTTSDTSNSTYVDVNTKEESHTQDLENISYVDTKVYTESGTEANLSDYKDSSVMMFFFDPEDENSIDVLKKVEKQYENYKEKIKFLIISISKEVPQNIKDEAPTLIYYDLDKEYETKYGITEFPAMIYIYNDNSIMNAKTGVPSEDALQANLDILSDNI